MYIAAAPWAGAAESHPLRPSLIRGSGVTWLRPAVPYESVSSGPCGAPSILPTAQIHKAAPKCKAPNTIYKIRIGESGRRPSNLLGAFKLRRSRGLLSLPGVSSAPGVLGAPGASSTRLPEKAQNNQNSPEPSLLGKSRSRNKVWSHRRCLRGRGREETHHHRGKAQYRPMRETPCRQP